MSDYKLPNGQYLEDIYISTYENDKWGKATLISPNINSPDCEASINLSADGKNLLIYKDDNGDGNIYVSELKGNEWGVPEYEMSPINSNAWETHACFSADNKVLYFVSDRLGGFGGRDIYKCLKLPNGKWGPAQNLGETINTKYDEDGVFICPDGKQIFFASKGHNSMGGFDIFTSIINDENGFWSPPINYGYPVNTADDDVFLVTSPDGRRAFFSSDKEGGYGAQDIYMIKFPDYEPRDITILLGNIINNSTENISNNKIVFVNMRTGDTTQVLDVNSNTGKFGANIPVGDDYIANFYINGQKVYSEQLEAPKGLGYTVLRREIPYNGKGTADTALIVHHSVVKDTTKKYVDHTLKIDKSVKEDTAVVVDKTPPEKEPTKMTEQELMNREMTLVPPVKKDTVVKKETPAKKEIAKKEPIVKKETIAKKDTVIKAKQVPCNENKTVFQVNFKYNKKDIARNTGEFGAFIDALYNCISQNPKYEISIEASASTVPTQTYKTNENLVHVRATTAHDNILKALIQKGIKESDIVFSPIQERVQGPEYKNDAVKNKAVYEQYQYVKVFGAVKK